MTVVDVTLRPTLEADLRFVLAAERAADNAPFIRHWPEGEHSKALVDPGTAHWIAEDGATGETVGYVILLGLANPHRSVEFKRIVVTRKRAGFGRAIVREVKRRAFHEHGAHRLWLEVKTFNHRAHALYRSEGFREEGTLRDVIRGEEGYESLIVMSILDSEYVAP